MQKGFWWIIEVYICNILTSILHNLDLYDEYLNISEKTSCQNLETLAHILFKSMEKFICITDCQ